MNRRQRRKKKVQRVQTQSMLGAIIDMPQEQFEEELIKQKTNIGTVNNLILTLESVYGDFRQRKDSVLDLVFKGVKDKDDPEVKKALDGLYAEMTKLELKITHLKNRQKDLIDLDNTPE